MKQIFQNVGGTVEFGIEAYYDLFSLISNEIRKDVFSSGGSATFQP